MSYFPSQSYTTLPVWINGSVPSSIVAWTNQPAATTEFYGTTRRRPQVSLMAYTYVRLYTRIDVVANAGALLAGQYSLDDGVTWVYLDGSADGALTTQEPQVPIDALGTQESGWIALDPAAKKDTVVLRCVGVGGNAAADPSFMQVILEFK